MNIIYLRVSDDEQNEENQLESVKEIAPGNSVIIRERQSAWKDNHRNRPKFKKIYEDVKAGKVLSFNCWSLDRIYRNRVRTVGFLRLCNINNCIVRTVQQKWLSKFEEIPYPFNEIMGELMVQIIAWIAEEESRLKSERVKAAIGKNGKSKYGKKWGRKKTDLNVLKIRELRAKNKSLREIAKMFDVSHSTIKRALENREK